VGDVRIVTGILDSAGLRAVFGQTAELQAHLHLLALGQHNIHSVRTQAAE